jgi:uncharacterized protein
MWFDALVLVAGLAGGVIAAVAGFGIGSLLTPALASQVDARLAVAAVAIPHIAGTAFRFWLLGGRFDWQVLRTFGVASAAGGLAGALMQDRTPTPALTVLFGLLLLFTAAAELTGFGRRMRFTGVFAPVAGAASGVLGGLVGNQGGIRSAALLGAHVSKDVFVGTATAVGLMVDVARVPVYIWRYREGIGAIGPWVAIAMAGVITGTLIGRQVLRWIPEPSFRRIVGVLLGLLGAAMVASGLEAQ